MSDLTNEVCSTVLRWVGESKEFYLKGTCTNVKQSVRWIKPAGDTIKFNTDGAYFSGTNHFFQALIMVGGASLPGMLMGIFVALVMVICGSSVILSELKQRHV
jgi:hypothetical protein